ncbi:hypothetical protein JX265_001549 [Neoarthrinium moseri]|uniref:Rhodopsin domain-containing protein n=1 Tax=Neoarthrinium moseri TaxID=1658444 RepID=A0A9P9WVN9_9PEZI|nr:hypothetical protein JX266_009237 [Neoarthrinium moseri]KAI1879928.1 hypothetical protein JX265_001549 [Neoarthrinium moseri]
MRIPPLSVLATWPRPNYNHPETRGPAGKVLAVALTTLVTLILAIRIYTRRAISKSFGLDDILIVAAYIPALTFAICGIFAEVSFGWDRHIWDVRYELLSPGLKMSVASFCLFDLASNLTKLSTLAMLYRLIRPTKSRMKIVVIAACILVTCSSLVFVFVVIFQCSPVWDYWTLSTGPQNCIDEAAHLLSAGIINTVTDFIVVLLPIKTVAGLQLPRKQYIILIVLFCAGFVACVAGVVRTYYTWMLTIDYDRTWEGWTVWISSLIELDVGILCASVPSIKQFFTLYLPSVIGTTRRSTKPDKQSHDRNSTRLTVTVNTTVETTYENRSSIELMEGPQMTLAELLQLDELEKPATPPEAAIHTRSRPGSHFEAPGNQVPYQHLFESPILKPVEPGTRSYATSISASSTAL